MKKRYLFGTLIVAALIVPTFTAALTSTEIQAQIQILLNKIAELQAQLAISNSTSGILTVNNGTTTSSCPILSRTLSRGSRGEDVRSLQTFLIEKGVLESDLATGFYGLQTEIGVQKWQAQNSVVGSGDALSTGYGVVGTRTRAIIIDQCFTKRPSTILCPQYQAPQCGSGKHIEYGSPDANGCKAAPRCYNDALVCPIYSACPSGNTTNISIDSNGCTKITCTTSAIACPAVANCGPGYNSSTYTDSNGCNKVSCTQVSAATCPAVGNCSSGYTTSTYTDTNGCTKINCTPITCPAVSNCGQGYTATTYTDSNGCTKISCTTTPSCLAAGTCAR